MYINNRLKGEKLTNLVNLRATVQVRKAKNIIKDKSVYSNRSVKLYLNFKSHGNFLEDFYAKIFSIGDL
jgi:hypothetical protein